MPFLIDGHNLIACLPDIDIDDPHDEAKLVTKLKGFVARKRVKCTVVFDQGLPGGKSPMSTKAVTVIFAAAQHTNADNVIKRRIGNIRDASNWTVVSSDHDVLNYARHHRMKLMTSAQFSSELQRVSRPQETRGEETHPVLTEHEVDAWLDMFGGDDGSETPERRKGRK